MREKSPKPSPKKLAALSGTNLQPVSGNAKSSLYSIGYVALGTALLPLTLLLALDYPTQVDGTQAIFWYYTYEHGLVPRGLRGTVVNYFYGPLSVEDMRSLIARAERILIVVVAIMFWGMLVPRIWTCGFPDRTKMMLVAFSAVLLLAPVWRFFGFMAGFGDEWTALLGVLAFFSFLGKRPFIYACCIVIGYMIHPQGLIYACMLAMFVVHSILRNPAYAQRWRTWLAAAIFPLCIIASLYSLFSQDTSHDALALIYSENNHKFSLLLEHWLSHVRWLHAEGTSFSGHITAYVLSELAEKPLWYAKLLLPNVMQTAIYGILFSYACVRCRISEKAGFLAAGQPLLAKLVPHECYIITMGSFALFLPLVIFAPDRERFLHIAWIGMSMATAYLLWFYASAASGARENNMQEPVKTRRAAPGAITVFMAVWAYAFAGAPLIVLRELHDVCVLCQGPTYLLNKNPLGEWFSQGIYEIKATGNTSYHFDAKKFHSFQMFMFASPKLYRLENGKLWISKDMRAKLLLKQNFIVNGGQTAEFELNHEGETSNPVILNNCNRRIPAIHADKNKTIWRYQIEETQRACFTLFSVSERDYRIVNARLVLHD